jgi:RNA polymerase sigma-70 factor (ECF subfamily)
VAILEAQRRLIADYSERGYQFAYRLCDNVDDAKELVQEAFYRVFRSWDRYDSQRSLEGWFLGILRNVYTDKVRRYERRHGVSLDMALAGQGSGELRLADAIADPREEEILDRLCREDLRDEVRRALDSLNPEQKAVLELCDGQGFTYEEISEVLGCPINTVRSRLSRARIALRKALLKIAKEAGIDGL